MAGGYGQSFQGGQNQQGSGHYGQNQQGGGQQGWGQQGDSSGHRHQHDPHYSSWRQKQIEQLDSDYDRFNQQRQSQFDQEFSEWRSKNRQDDERDGASASNSPSGLGKTEKPKS